jgi:P-type E1-E2 ATPase
VKPAIKKCHTAGIRVIMITGDSKETATAIAKQLDIIDESHDLKSTVFTGS